MRPTKETLQEFITLYEEEFHERLSEAAALEMWVRVMDFFLFIYRNPKQDDGADDMNRRAPSGIASPDSTEHPPS